MTRFRITYSTPNSKNVTDFVRANNAQDAEAVIKGYEIPTTVKSVDVWDGRKWVTTSKDNTSEGQ